MTTDYRDLITRMANELDEYRRLLLDDCTVTHRLSNEARAALADGPAVPEGKKPTRDELWELWLRLNNELLDRPAAVAEFWEHAQVDARARARAVRARWGKVAPVPVPVSERLPKPSDCAPWPKDSDASAWCWVGTDQDDGWNWEQRSAGCLAMFPDDFTHWLPAHALPLPEVGE